jgi:hypothetical protein
MPKRVQLSRRKGYRRPDGVVYVGRPSKWGNPFVVKAQNANGGRYRPGGRYVENAKRRHQVVEMFRGMLLKGEGEPWATMLRDLPELRGKDLACWCPITDPMLPGRKHECHADVLLEEANR